MGQRNMSYTIPTHDTETEQGGHPPYYGISPLPPNNFNSHGPPPYGITPYHQGQFNGAFKTKNAQVFPGNFHYFYPAPNDVQSGPHQRIVGNRASEAIIPGNYGQPLQFVPIMPWLDSWNHATPRMPYIQGCVNGGGMEAANMGPHGYQVIANGNSGQVPHNLHHVPPHNIVMGPTRVYHPHRAQSTATHRCFPHFRLLPQDGVAILDISGYHQVGHSVDHHRDMRLDIDHMSYEELLALGEQIGSVGSGLSDDFIVGHLKMRIFASSKSSSHAEHQQLNLCVICQTDYKKEEKIGVVDCGHEYHVDCIKKWLVVKNTCPVCKSTALES